MATATKGKRNGGQTVRKTAAKKPQMTPAQCIDRMGRLKAEIAERNDEYDTLKEQTVSVLGTGYHEGKLFSMNVSEDGESQRLDNEAVLAYLSERFSEAEIQERFYKTVPTKGRVVISSRKD